MDGSEVFENQYWKINKVMLKTVGLWPYQKMYVKICIRTFILIAIHSMMIPQIIRTFFEWGKNSEIVIENITGFFYFQAIILKYITNFQAESKLQYVYEKIHKDWKEFNEEGEVKVLSCFANQGRFLTIGYVAYLYTAGSFFVTLPCLIPTFLDLVVPLNESRQKVLCFYGEYFIDQQDYYYILFVHTFICVMCTIMLYTTIDASYACCVEHLVGLFNIVDFRLKKAFELAQSKYAHESDALKAKIHNCVRDSIMLHNQSIQFVDLLQTTFTTCFFITTGLTLICLSLGTVDLMMSSSNYVNMARVAFAWMGIVLYLFYVSMPGQRIIDASSEILNSIYSCGWYNFPLKTQHLLKFMMMRCSVPCQFTAGPLLVLNLANCGVVLKSAMSYCTFVTTMS